jgi:hypothetical protein
MFGSGFVLLATISMVLFLSICLIFLRYPDKLFSIITFCMRLTCLVAIFDLNMNTPILDVESAKDVLGNTFQASAALTGILGSFLVYYIDTVKHNIFQVRKEVTRMIQDLDFATIVASDAGFIEYANKPVVWKEAP